MLWSPGFGEHVTGELVHHEARMLQPPTWLRIGNRPTSMAGRMNTNSNSAWSVQQCSICLLDVLEEQHHSFAHPDSGCTHRFHWDCLANSLALSSQCPNCRRSYHELGVFEVLPDNGGKRLHVPDLRVRDSHPAADNPQGGILRRFCQSRLGLPTVVLILASPIVVTFWVKMARDA